MVYIQNNTNWLNLLSKEDSNCTSTQQPDVTVAASAATMLSERSCKDWNAQATQIRAMGPYTQPYVQHPRCHVHFSDIRKTTSA
jgi:hypothetical protein